MKRHLLIGLLSIISSVGFGQEKETRTEVCPSCKCGISDVPKITFDFSDKTIKGYDDLKLSKGDLYQVEINNINQNVYRIILNESDTIVTKPIDYSSFSVLDPSKLSSLVAGITTAVKSVSPGDTMSLTKLSKNILGNKNKNTEFEAFFDKNEEDLKQIDTEFAAIQTAASDIASKHEKFSELYESTVAQLKRAKLLENNEQIGYEKLMSFEKSADETRTETKDAIEEFESKVKNLNEIIDNLLKENTNVELHAKLKTIKDKMNKLAVKISKLKEEVSQESIDKIISQYVDAINNFSRTYTSFPMQYNGDKSNLRISIEPIDSASRLPTYSGSYTLPKQTLFYLAVGPGLYYSNLSDDRFSTRGVQLNDSITEYQMVPENLKNKEIGVSVLIRTGTKLKNCDVFGYHATLGAGLSFTNPTRIRALYGGGISLGRIHSLNFDLLGTTGYVEVQSSSVNENMTFTEAPASYTVSKLRTKVGFSIGYTYTF